MGYKRKNEMHETTEKENQKNQNNQNQKTSGGNTISTKITKTKPKEWLNKRNVLLNNIWNDNGISMRTGMLFDPNFLTFMRDLLVMSSGVVDTKTIKDEQKEKKANKKANKKEIKKEIKKENQKVIQKKNQKKINLASSTMDKPIVWTSSSVTTDEVIVHPHRGTQKGVYSSRKPYTPFC